MAKTVMVHLDHREIENLVSSPYGSVGKDLNRRAKKVQLAAKRQVGKRTHRLERSIRIYDRHAVALGQTLKIGSAVPYAYMHHEGTRRHVITPRTHEFLTFSPKGGRSAGWNVIGGKIMAKSAVIPRVRPNRYLSDNVKWFYI